MKEATGEANMTIITVVLIGIILGVGTLLVTNLMNTTKKRAECQAEGQCLINGTCQACPDNP